MEQKEDVKLTNGKPTVFSKIKFYTTIGVIVFSNIAALIWWGGKVETHVSDTTIHEDPKEKSQRIEKMLSPYMRKEIIELKFESLDEKYDDIRSELKEIKKILQSK